MKVSIIDWIVRKLKRCIGIIEDGDTASTAISKGKYVVWKGNLYTADSAISAGTTLSASGGSKNLTAVSEGAANSLLAVTDSLNSKISKHSNSGTTTCDLPLNARNVVAIAQYGTSSALQPLSFVFPIGVANANISRLAFTQGYYLNATTYAFCQISYNSSTEKIAIGNLTISGTDYSSTSQISVTYEV